MSGEVPETYLGVRVPDVLKSNWDQSEAFWWRLGVRCSQGVGL